MLKKIVIIGPESTGKSTLCELLSKHFDTQWVPEYAREYLLKHGTTYTFEDLLTIARGQLALEEKAIAAFPTTGSSSVPKFERIETEDQLLFIDTDQYVMKVWCEYVFGKCHQWIIDEITTRTYDLYLLCDTDLPWVKDELREYPDLETREKLFHMYKDIMINQSTPWIKIKGSNEERIQMAIDAVTNWNRQEG